MRSAFERERRALEDVLLHERSSEQDDPELVSVLMSRRVETDVCVMRAALAIVGKEGAEYERIAVEAIVHTAPPRVGASHALDVWQRFSARAVLDEHPPGGLVDGSQLV